MASIPVLLLVLVFLLSVDYANAQTNHSNNISLGSSLSTDANRTSWLSPSRHFAFGFYPHGDGFAIGIWLINQTEKTVTWTAKRDDPLVSSNATLELTRDGLQLRVGAVKNITYIDRAPLRKTASAAMLDSGNFVLYNNLSVVLWQTFEKPTDTILGGQNLSNGDLMVSSVSKSDQTKGQFSLLMQTDGNLAAYLVNSSDAPSSNSFWSSGTDNSGTDVMLTLNASGVLFLHGDRLGVRILASSHYPDKKNVTIIHRATLDADGIFRLYSHHFESDNSSSMVVEWSSLANQCEVSGFCGWSSYCSGVGSNNGPCKCYPGFHFINSSNKFLGCYRNFSDNGCRRSGPPAMLSRIVSLENILWGDYPYSSVQMKKNDCNISCLEDCNCAVALYGRGSCDKYKLPLRYSRASKNISATAFIKVIWKNITSPSIPFHSETVGPKIERGLILILAITLGSISCLCFMFAIYTIFRYKHQVYKYRSLSENTNLGLIEEFTLRSFSYNELEQATDGFKEELGKGTFGVVYKGTIPGTVGDERTAGYFYLAPEWKLNAFISIKADIYSFGIVLLEIVCCRRSIEVNVPTTDEIILSSWVYDCFMAGELEKLVEDENVDFVTLERMVKVGLWCIQEDPALRPLMKNAILMLEGTMDVPVPPSPVRSLVVS
ncbi:hypothetical protein FH972_002859 [Carpinus fangiana]|uniref:Bulb-type lectin domain-containing protein n=1 Tax=Carpinus fangiana TaxID=176857 RepID=A0A5N6QIJ8_9ROSI|nr:hypothetical protein FH972_002859 [Carpinus fangiana]